MPENGGFYGDHIDIPGDFRWIKLWPDSLGWVSRAFAVVMIGMGIVAIEKSVLVASILVAGGLGMLSSGVVADNPAVVTETSGVRIGYRVWARSSQTYTLTAIGAVLLSAVVGGASGVMPRIFLYAGVPCLCAVLYGLVAASVIRSRSYIRITDHTVSVKIRRDCWQVPLTESVELIADIERSAGDQPCLRFSCPPGTSVDLAAAEPRTNVDTVEHVIRSKDFTVEPNALASTLFFLRSHPDVRVSPQALSRMLIPPPRSVRRRLAIKEAIAYEW